MTEPPEDEDYESAWERADADEIMGGLEDDALLDSIAKGVRGDLGPDQLTELLSGLRDRPDDHDIPMPNTARVERGENVLPPRPTEGAPQPMSAQEEAARLRALAQDTATLGALQQAETELNSLRDQVSSALGHGHSKISDALALIQSAIEQVQTATGVVQAALQNLDDIAGTIG